MNILFDFITTQTTQGGGGEYLRRVFYELIKRNESSHSFNIIGIIDSTKNHYAYNDLSHEDLKKKCYTVVDIKGRILADIVKEYSIDTIFVGVLQQWASIYTFKGVYCKVITIAHDLHYEEMEDVCLYGYLAMSNGVYGILRQLMAKVKETIFKRLLHKEKSPIATTITELSNNPQWQCITVSEYSKYSFIYHYNFQNVKILASPERIMHSNGIPENKVLENIILSKTKFYLLVSANRPEKNAQRALKAFDKFRNNYLQKNGEKNLPIIVTLGLSKQYCKGHICLPLLSESDLVCAYKHCYALIYSSFFEGFGYPPVEAMKYNKPVLASNVTSITEVLGDAPIYFSPYYTSDIFKALCKLSDYNRELYVEKSKQRYMEIAKKQSEDLNELINLLTV